MGLNIIQVDVASGVQAFALKDQLLEDGLVWSKDFVWRYHPSQTDDDYINHKSAFVEFTFANESLATYYRLKWS